jgi:hypothetical protein
MIAIGKNFKIYIESCNGPVLLGFIKNWSFSGKPTTEPPIECREWGGDISQWSENTYCIANLWIKKLRTKEMVFR